jgi:CO/xanthine dehydrogenase Mo-binding subunit
VGNQDRAATWDKNSGIDRIFGTAGGMAVWVRREEGAGRAAVRGGTSDLVQTSMDLAAMTIALERLMTDLAASLGMAVDDLRRMVAIAADTMHPIIEHATRIKPKE